MKTNMGFADKIIRTIIATVMIALYFTQVVSGTLGIVLIVLSVVFLLTSLLSFCPIYAIFGLTSKSKMK